MQHVEAVQNARTCAASSRCRRLSDVALPDLASHFSALHQNPVVTKLQSADLSPISSTLSTGVNGSQRGQRRCRSGDHPFQGPHHPIPRNTVPFAAAVMKKSQACDSH
eukprot:1181981-Prorocentrum_minimum.AAC.1